MLNHERADFDKQLTVMLGGFPGYFVTPERLESYWRGLHKMQMSSLVRIVDFVLSEDGPEKIPSVSALWDIYRKLKTVRADCREPDPSAGKLSREAHLAHMRRAAINVAKNETMPMLNGERICRTAPPRLQREVDELWKQWDATFGKEPDEYFLSRATELMRMWGNEKAPEALNPNDALQNFG